jgi:hypothetical protein
MHERPPCDDNQHDTGHHYLQPDCVHEVNLLNLPLVESWPNAPFQNSIAFND